MGAWGPGNFSNDTALDFIAGTLDMPDVLAALALPDGTYIDADKAAEALAAADLVAAMIGRAASDMPDEEAARIAGWGAPDPAHLEAARQAVAKVRAGSELAELWAEDEDEDWDGVLADLLVRLDPDAAWTPPDPVDEPVGEIFGHCTFCEKGIPEAELVELVHVIDDGVLYSSMTLYAHRSCVESTFDPPHWADDGSPSAHVLEQFARRIGV